MAARKNSPQRRTNFFKLSYTLLNPAGSTKYLYNSFRWWCQGCFWQNFRILRQFASSTLLVSFSNIMQSMDDQCPVCKSDRYLNPKLRLLVSSCYHKMFVLSCRVHLSSNHSFHRCESCIDRLFTLGPAPCPICNKVLRKLAFTPQTFEDLGVEKEVAIRRRIAKE
jgi:rubrerythrin